MPDDRFTEKLERYLVSVIRIAFSSKQLVTNGPLFCLFYL